MPTAQELKKVREVLDAQIAQVEQVEQEAEEALVAAKKACLEEEERVRELAREAKEVWVWAEEEARRQEGEWCAWEEQDHLAME